MDFAQKVGEIKARVARLRRGDGYSTIWREVSAMYGYLQELSPDSLRAIRFHASLTNGFDVTRYWHPYPAIDPSTEAVATGFVRLTQGVPEQYWCSEPEVPEIPRPLGVRYKNVVINGNLTRYQNCVSVLYFAGLLENLRGRTIVEVGGGYGGLAHCLRAMTGARYVIVDLPEILFMSAVFLTLNNPESSMWVYDGGSVREALESHDLVMLPNYAADELLGMGDIALLLNLQSFQEMDPSIVARYLDIAKERASCVYSDNMDRHPYNDSDLCVSRLLAERFRLYPSVEFYADDALKGIDPQSYAAYRKYVGTNGAAVRPIPEHLLRPSRLSTLRRRLAPVEGLVRRIVR